MLAFDDLGTEAIHEFTLRDLPVTVAVDAGGRSVHRFVEIAAAATAPSFRPAP